MTLPNFLIIGSPRCGSTTLYESLKRHPEIYLSPLKEPNFFILEGEEEILPGPFSPKGPRDLDGYLALFRGARDEKAIGEASIYYLSSPRAPLRIKHYIPDAKFIAIFRNPVDRAFSNFLLNRMYLEPIPDFEKAMDAEEDRMKKGWFPVWSYRSVGFYAQHLERFFSHFDTKQFRFFLFEDLFADRDGLFLEIFRFLGVDEGIRIQLPGKFTASGVPRNKFIHDFLTKPNIIKSQIKRILPERIQYRLFTEVMNRNLSTPSLSKEARHRLLEIYREDILKTQDLIHRDLSSWLVL